MDSKIFEGEWDQIKGNLKKHFGRLTDDQLTEIEGNNQAIYGALEKEYGYTKDKAKEAVSSFLENSASAVKEWLPHLSKSVSRQVDQFSSQFKDCTSRSSEVVREKVQESPLVAISLAAAVGFLMGCWFKK